MTANSVLVNVFALQLVLDKVTNKEVKQKIGEAMLLLGIDYAEVLTKELDYVHKVEMSGTLTKAEAYIIHSSCGKKKIQVIRIVFDRLKCELREAKKLVETWMVDNGYAYFKDGFCLTY